LRETDFGFVGMTMIIAGLPAGSKRAEPGAIAAGRRKRYYHAPKPGAGANRGAAATLVIAPGQGPVIYIAMNYYSRVGEGQADSLKKYR